jgi:hypothetical protein
VCPPRGDWAIKSKTELIAYIRGLSDEDAQLAEIQSVVDGFQPPYVAGTEKPKMRKPHEKQYVDSTVNPAFLVELRDIAIDYNIAYQNYYGRQWPRFQEQVKMIEAMAKQSGIDLASYAPEVVSPTDLKAVDDVFSMTEKQCLQMADRIQNSHEKHGLGMLPDVKKKRWARVLKKVAQLQRWCRTEIPEKIRRKGTRAQKETWRYLHPLRYALYVLRSHLMSEDGTPGLIECPPHLIKTVMVMECAEYNCVEYGIDGVLVVFPPRHGKTTIMQAKKALGICKHGHFNNAIIHHNQEHANDRVQAVKDHFDLDTDVGKRRRALFPHVSLDDKRSKNKRELSVLHNGKRLNIEKEGNLKAYGVHSQSQGVTIHKMDADDPSDQKEQAEEGTRTRTNAALAQTWLPRLTGRQKFLIYICTRWHPEDFVGVLLRQAKQGDMNLAYVSFACGGPDDDFEPIWAEAGYGRDFLRGAYGRLGPIMYACQYQNDPDAKESRKVKQLCCFDSKELDPTTRSEPYKRFFNDPETKFYLSVDPAGTSSKTSHKAGITGAAFGNLRDDNNVDHPKLIFFKMWSVHEGQLGLAQMIADHCEDPTRERDTDCILVETTSGFHATPEALEKVHGIPSSKVIRRPPGVGTKVDRLLKYAIHLEGGDALFPGVWVLGERGEMVLQIDPEWMELAIQILQAASAADDHLLDCVRQQLAEVSPDIYARKYVKNDPRQDRKLTGKALLYKQLADAARKRQERMSRTPHRFKRNARYFQGASVA